MNDSLLHVHVNELNYLSTLPAHTLTQCHRFLLQFTMSVSGPSVLNVVETNPFRHLNHLSLKFISASDAYLKKYLAECLLGLKVHVTYSQSKFS